MPGSNTTQGTTSTYQPGRSYALPFAVVTIVFFMWGFITINNDILIPYMKKVFELSYFQAMLVQFAFYGAYFIGSLLYFIFSMRFGDPISKIGYKNGMIYGLLVSALGCALFYPAAEIKMYILFLASLFLIALGLTIQQIAANPYVALLGKPGTASSRLNLSQGFNSFGTMIAPIIGGFLILEYFGVMGEPYTNLAGDIITTEGGKTISGLGVKAPYLIFGGFFVIVALILKFTNLPRFAGEDDIPRDPGALRHRQLVWGMVAIFFYVGAEVTIGSLIINFFGLPQIAGMSETTASSFLAYYWGGAMIGRFIGAVSLSDMKAQKKNLYMLLLAVAGFGITYLATYIHKGVTLEDVWIYPVFVVLNLAAFKLGRSLPGRTMGIFAIINGLLLISTLLSQGEVAVWSVLPIGLFNSVMWSNIFTLAIKDLGKYTSQGSSLLVMMILGGALLPLFQGWMADVIGVHMSFAIPLLSYIYLIWYGFEGSRPGLFKCYRQAG